MAIVSVTSSTKFFGLMPCALTISSKRLDYRVHCRIAVGGQERSHRLGAAGEASPSIWVLGLVTQS